MKKIIALVLALIVAVGLFIYSFIYRNNQSSSIDSDIEYTTSVKKEDVEFTENDIIAESKEGGYKLYFKDDTAMVTCGDAKAEFNSWSKAIATKTPDLYFNDFDNDGEGELIIRLVDDSSDITGKTEYSYVLYLFKPYTDSDGNAQLKIITAQSSTWKNVFSKGVKLEVTQLKNCKKYVQYVMTDVGKTINYDNETGISTNKYVAFTRCDSDSKKNYYTVKSCKKGLGTYSVDENGKIYLDIQVIINYEETDLNYHVGYIHCELHVDNEMFKFTANSIHLVPLDEYTISDPREIPQNRWNYTITNTGSAKGNDNTIRWIECVLDVSNGTKRNMDFGSFSSDITKIDKIDISENSVTLTAKDGFSFDKSIVDNGSFKIFIDNGHKDDVSYQASINGNKLTICLQKGYPQSKLTDFAIQIGK